MSDRPAHLAGGPQDRAALCYDICGRLRHEPAQSAPDGGQEAQDAPIGEPAAANVQVPPGSDEPSIEVQCGWCLHWGVQVGPNSEDDWFCSKWCEEPLTALVRYHCVPDAGANGWRYGKICDVDTHLKHENEDRYLIKPVTNEDESAPPDRHKRFNFTKCECGSQCVACVQIVPFDHTTSILEGHTVSLSAPCGEEPVTVGTNLSVEWLLDGSAVGRLWDATVTAVTKQKYYNREFDCEVDCSIVSLQYMDNERGEYIIRWLECEGKQPELQLIPANPNERPLQAVVRVRPLERRWKALRSCEIVWLSTPGYPAWPAYVIDVDLDKGIATIEWRTPQAGVAAQTFEKLKGLRPFETSFKRFANAYDFLNLEKGDPHRSAVITALHAFKGVDDDWESVAKKLGYKDEGEFLDRFLGRDPSHQQANGGAGEDVYELSDSTDYNDSESEEEEEEEFEEDDQANKEENRPAKRRKRAAKRSRVHVSSLEQDLAYLREEEIDKLEAACLARNMLFDREKLVCRVELGGQAEAAPSKHTFVDLFCSCGGLSLGLMQAGMKCVGACERDPAVAAVHDQMVGTDGPECKVEDVETFAEKVKQKQEGYPRPEDVSVVVGGPPCQCYSGLNRYRNGGEEDKVLRLERAGPPHRVGAEASMQRTLRPGS